MYESSSQRIKQPCGGGSLTEGETMKIKDKDKYVLLHEPSVELLGLKKYTVYILHEQGVPIEDIATLLSIAKPRVRELYKRAFLRMTYEPHWMDGMSIGAINPLWNAGIKTIEALIEAHKSGRLLKLRNFGKARLKEVEQVIKEHTN